MILCASLLLAFPHAALGGDKPTGSAFSYQGQLKQAGEPVNNSADMQFRLFDGASAGTTQIGATLQIEDLVIADGLFTVDLDFGPGAFSGQARWLEIAVRVPHDPTNTQPFVTLTPRQPINPSPYALHALSIGAVPDASLSGTYTGQLTFNNTSNSFAGSFSGAFAGNGSAITNLNASSLSSGPLPSARLSGTYSQALTFSNSANSFSGTFSGNGANLTNLHAPNITTGKLNPNRLPSGGGWPLSNDLWIGNHFYIDIHNNCTGIGTDTPISRLHVETDGFLTGTFASSSNVGTWLNLGNTSENGRYWRLISTGPGNGGAGRLLIGYGNSPAFHQSTIMTLDNKHVGIGTEFPAHPLHVSHGSIGPAIFAEHTTAGMETPAILGLNTGINYAGIGVEGQGAWVGVRGVGAATNNGPQTGNRIGVRGEASVNSSEVHNIGVYGRGESGSASYGVYGYSPVGTFRYAGYFSGHVSVDEDLAVGGTLYKAGGSFRIDHPLDPENKYLYHSFVESPDMMNIYNGNVVTDAQGYATITMPDWFEALNRDFRYQLTVVDEFDDDTFVQVKVVQKMRNGQFVIRTSQPHVEVSWQVTGIRQDAWANANRIPLEVEKSLQDKGLYLHPEVFGQPREKGLGWRHSPEALELHERK